VLSTMNSSSSRESVPTGSVFLSTPEALELEGWKKRTPKRARKKGAKKRVVWCENALHAVVDLVKINVPLGDIFCEWRSICYLNSNV